MTYEEQQIYDKLSSDQKDDYNHLRSKHPGWSHNQIIQKLAVDDKITKILEDGGDVNPDDPQFMSEILKGAKEFLLNLGIIIDSFFEAIDAALNVLDNIIEAGINYIGDKLKTFWDWLTN